MVIGLINSKGGVGKTTLSVHLAVWLHEQGRRVVFVDADAQGSAGGWLAEAQPDLRVVPLHTAAAILERVPQLAADADVVVADGPAGLAEQSRALMMVADLVLVPVGGSVLDLRAAAIAVDVVQTAQRLRKGRLPKARLVLNRIQTHTLVGQEAIDAAARLGLLVSGRIVRQRSALADAAGQGSVVWRMGSGAADAADDLQALFQEVMRG